MAWPSVAVIAVAGLALGACGGPSKAPQGYVVESQLIGMVIGDEPRSVAIGRDILTQGGSAADAAVAVAFALATTLPSRAGLGGGGSCLVRAGRAAIPEGGFTLGLSKAKTPLPTQAIDFMPEPVGRGEIGRPALLRGLGALHAKFGKMRWEQLVAPAENLARFGNPMARSLARDTAASGIVLTGADDKPLNEGDVLMLPELAGSLALIRTRGAAVLFVGELAEAYVFALDGAIDAKSLAATVAQQPVTKPVPIGDNVAYFTASSGGALAATLTAALARDRRADRRDPVGRAQAVADAADKSTPITGELADYGSTGFVVVDNEGATVACSLTMGQLFGARKLAGLTGIIAASPTPAGSPSAQSVVAAVVTNDNSRSLYASVAAGRDPGAPQAVVQTLFGAVVAERPLAGVLAEGRSIALGGGVALAEPVLKLAGTQTREIADVARVNAVVCTGGLPSEPATCAAQNDGRGLGLAAVADKAK